MRKRFLRNFRKVLEKFWCFGKVLSKQKYYYFFSRENFFGAVLHYLHFINRTPGSLCPILRGGSSHSPLRKRDSKFDPDCSLCSHFGTIVRTIFPLRKRIQTLFHSRGVFPNKIITTKENYGTMEQRFWKKRVRSPSPPPVFLKVDG